MNAIAHAFIAKLAQQKIQYEKEKLVEEEEKRRKTILKPPIFFFYLQRSLQASKKVKRLKRCFSVRKKSNTLLKTFMNFEHQESARRRRLEQEENEKTIRNEQKKQYDATVSLQELEFYRLVLAKNCAKYFLR